MNSTVIPIIRYRDADKAIDWLCRAFGFKVFLKVGDEKKIEHARLTLGESMVMLASLDREGKFDDQFKSPSAIGGITQALLFRVSEPHAVYRTARAAGAMILDDLNDARFGGQLFSCTDPESHVWVFTSGDMWLKSW